MLRITRTDHPKRVLPVIEGKLAGDNVGVIETACEEALSKKAAVTVFLKDVLEVDEAGKKLLTRLAGTRIRLRALGVYSRFLIRKILEGARLPGIRENRNV